MDLQKVKAHLAALTATVDALEKAHLDVTNGSLNNDAPGGGFDTPAELQGRLLAELRNMKIAVQGPERYLFTLRAEAVKPAVLLAAVRSGVLHCVVEAQGRNLTAKEISDQCDIDQNLVVRIMRFLTSILGVCVDTGVETYASNALADLVDSPAQIAAIDFFATINWPPVGSFPKYVSGVGLRQLGQEPTPFNNHFGGTIWQVLERDRAMKQVFDHMFVMLAQQAHRRTWDVYPIASALNGNSDEVSIVDVGGGRGHDLIAAIRMLPDAARGRFILQDLPRALDGIEADSLPLSIEKQAYDFFSGPQPVKAAGMYFMHDIMHNHNDKNAAVILSNIAEAMSKTSRLVIAEWIVRDQNAQQQACFTDWTMLMTTSGIERSLPQWTALLGGAGLRIVKVWFPREEGQSVIEAMLK